MNILIDNSNLQVGGGIQVGISFLNDLVTLNQKETFNIVVCPQFLKALGSLNFPENFIFHNVPASQMPVFKRIAFLKKLENKINPDVIFTVFGPSYHKSKALKIVGYAIPHFIYEDSPYFNIISLKSKIKLFFLKKIKLFNFNSHSDVLIFETKNAEKIYNKLYNSKKIPTYVVGNTLNQIFTKRTEWVESSYKTNTENTILCLMANYEHKNLKIVPKVIDSLREDFGFTNFKFVISLQKSELNFDSKYDANIDYIGKVSLKELPSLYQKMKIVFFPSLLEVFSTTFLEAMHMRVPLVASNMPFSKEISDQAALYFSPLDPKDAAKMIYTLFHDNALYRELQNNASKQIENFSSSLERTKKYLDIINKTYR